MAWELMDGPGDGTSQIGGTGAPNGGGGGGGGGGTQGDIVTVIFWGVGDTISNVPTPHLFDHLYHEAQVFTNVRPNPVCPPCALILGTKDDTTF